MKTRHLVKILCSLMISATPTLAHAQEPQAAAQAPSREGEMRSISDDPIGEWIEKNAAKYGLYYDRAPSKKTPTKVAPTKATPDRSAPPAPRAAQPGSSAATSTLSLSNVGYVVGAGAASTTTVAPDAPPTLRVIPPPVSKQEQDAIEAFFVNRVFDLSSEALSAPSLSGASTLTGAGSVLSQPSFESTTSSSPAASAAVAIKPFTPPADAVKSVSGAAQVAAVMDDLEYSDKCSSFATPNGFGVWGKAIIKEVVGGGANTLLQGTDDLRRACPNYDFLTVREKSHVWVNILASMSFLESSCDPRKLGKGPNGTAAGLLQLHAGRENEAAPGCNKRDSSSPITSLICGISIIETQIKRTNALFSRDTHFGVLRPQGDLIRTKAGPRRVVKARVVAGGIRELPICQRAK